MAAAGAWCARVGSASPSRASETTASTSSPQRFSSFAGFNGLRRGSGAIRVATQRMESAGARGRQRALHVVAMAEEAAIPALSILPLVNYINGQGRVLPPVEGNTAATVFAVYDQNKKIQYIGFSKDVRNSLRTLLCRRPELCYYYKLHNLPTLDQQQMLNIRQQWFSELGLPPTGNKDPTQRSQWEKPADAGSISERGKVAAGKSKAKTVLQILADRGLKETMEFDPVLLDQGLVDVLPAKGPTDEELASAAEAAAEQAAKRRQVTLSAPDGEVVEFEIVFEAKYKTNGGWMYDILVNKDDKETRHRVICGRIYPESVNIPEDTFVEKVMGFLLYKKVQRRTEGLMTGEQFPINYFSVSEVAQRHDDFKDWFSGQLPDSYWRFNRIHAYGAEIDPAPHTGPTDGISYDLLPQAQSS